MTPTADLTVELRHERRNGHCGRRLHDRDGHADVHAGRSHGDQTFTVSTTEDTLDEGTGETFSVTISNPSGGGGPTPTLGSTSSITTTIADDDAAPTAITLSRRVPPPSVRTDGTTGVHGDGDAGRESSTLATSTTVTITLGGTAT